MRKFLGIFLIVLGWLLGIAAMLSTIPNILKTFQEDTEIINKTAFLVGTFIGSGIFVFIAYLLIRTGIKLTKKKKAQDQMDKIMSIK